MSQETTEKFLNGFPKHFERNPEAELPKFIESETTEVLEVMRSKAVYRLLDPQSFAQILERWKDKASFVS